MTRSLSRETTETVVESEVARPDRAGIVSLRTRKKGDDVYDPEKTNANTGPEKYPKPQPKPETIKGLGSTAIKGAQKK
jgi:hypothetical protein